MSLFLRSFLNSKKIIICISILNSVIIFIIIRSTHMQTSAIESTNFFIVQVKTMSTFFSILSGIIFGLYQQYILSIINTIISISLAINVYLNFSHSSTLGLSILITSLSCLLIYLFISLFFSYSAMTMTILLLSGPDIKLNRRCSRLIFRCTAYQRYARCLHNTILA